MKVPFKKKGGIIKGAGAPSKLGGGVSGGNMSGLAQGLMAARPMKPSRMGGIKKKMMGGDL